MVDSFSFSPALRCGSDLPFVARMRICGGELEGGGEEVVESGFWVRKMEPWLLVCVVVRRVVRRVRNWRGALAVRGMRHGG